jgi:membrane-associated phospholipid phosphatase
MKSTLNLLVQVMDEIGYKGPIILLIIALFMLWTQWIYLVMFATGLWITIQATIMLKKIFRQSRPSNPIEFKKDEDYENETWRYGLPSMHASRAGYCFWYIFCAAGWINRIVIACAFIVATTLYQRWKYRRHTVLQLAAGVVLGIIIAQIMYSTAESSLTDKIFSSHSNPRDYWTTDDTDDTTWAIWRL